MNPIQREFLVWLLAIDVGFGACLAGYAVFWAVSEFVAWLRCCWQARVSRAADPSRTAPEREAVGMPSAQKGADIGALIDPRTRLHGVIEPFRGREPRREQLNAAAWHEGDRTLKRWRERYDSPLQISPRGLAHIRKIESPEE